MSAKTICKRILTIIIACTAPIISTYATHIIGGNIEYKCLGNNRYEILMHLRRDCINGQAPFDNPASLGIFDENNNLYASYDMPLQTADTLNETIITNCGQIGGDVCVHTTTYTIVVDLPFQKGGYTLAYQRCCRNYTISNLADPQNAGTTLTVVISEDALKECNSSPELGAFPPVYICGNNPIQFDLMAKDKEGDSLVYLMCNAIHGADQINPRPIVPSNPPYEKLLYKTPYSVNNMIGGNPALNIDQHKGIMSGFAENFRAQYLVTYCVLEYRKGVLLSTMYREFQINVRLCNTLPIADFKLELDQCKKPVELKIIDQSKDLYSVITNWNWEFNLNNIKSSQSGSTPSLTLPDSGSLRVQLTVGSREGCKDSLSKQITFNSIVPNLENKYFKICKGDTVRLINLNANKSNQKWTPTTDLSCSTCSSTLAYPKQTTAYILTSSDQSCSISDTVNIEVENCIQDSCEFNLDKVCLPNGQILVTAIGAQQLPIQSSYSWDLYWLIKLKNTSNWIKINRTNPITVNDGDLVKCYSTRYSWPPKYPKTKEFAIPCLRIHEEEMKLTCNGPCDQLNFILSSCEDDIDSKQNLNFPSNLCKSICASKCEYIIALFETNGTLINDKEYDITWSNRSKGSYVTLGGIYHDNLHVTVKKGDCYWYGHYTKLCENYNSLHGLSELSSRNGKLKISDLLNSKEPYTIYNMMGEIISTKIDQNGLPTGVYFIKTDNEIIKCFIENH